MPIIDPRPDADELAELGFCLKRAGKEIAAYLKSEAGQADPNHIPMATAALTLLTEADNVATAQLELATSDAGKAVDIINDATDELEAAIEARTEFSKDLKVIESLAAFAAALASGNVGGIISAGADVVKALKPDPSPAKG